LRHNDIPHLILELVRNEHWDFSAKVLQALEDYEFSEEDLKCCVHTGSLDKSERDEYGEAVDGRKYTILGRAVSGHSFYVCGKILCDGEGRFFFFITAHGRRH
jgi:hypothetical protein